MPTPPPVTVEETISGLLEQAKSRPIVPFLGAGISFSAGFPTIGSVNHYLAKTAFAIQSGIYSHRYPDTLRRGPKSTDPNDFTDNYRRHPGSFLGHFGWPEIGKLNADLWDWLSRDCKRRAGSRFPEGIGRIALKNLAETELRSKSDPRILGDYLAADVSSGPFAPELRFDVDHLELRHHLLAITQWALRQDLKRREPGSVQAALREWRRWKDWYHRGLWQQAPSLLYGDWESLLDSLCEGNFDLVDQLFSDLGKGRMPTISHRFLAFLQVKLGIPLMMSTNFDTLLEQAFDEEGVSHRTFDVHRDAELPDASLMRRQFSILKLHGSSYGLRFGERLRYPLEIEARTDILRYLPDDAIVVVMGFSGSERRIMQLINAVAQPQRSLRRTDPGRPNDPRNWRIVWLKGPGELSPMVAELLKNSNATAVRCDIAALNTFLVQLYFQYAGSFQSSPIGYPALAGRPVVKLDKKKSKDGQLPPRPIRETSHSDEAFDQEQITWRNKRVEVLIQRKAIREQQRRPVHIFSSRNDGPDDTNRSSWATLSAAAFVAQQIENGYQPIWIDLEAHHTVSGVVSELFEKVQRYDPQCPQFTMINQSKDVLDKAVSRVYQALARGRYVIVFDSLDSFGRTQTMHHGIPTFRAFDLLEKPVAESKQLKKKFEHKFKTRINDIRDFLDNLMFLTISRSSPFESLLDSFLCLTIDNPCLRHKHSISQPVHRRRSANDSDDPIICVRKALETFRIPPERENEYSHITFHREPTKEPYLSVPIAGLDVHPALATEDRPAYWSPAAPKPDKDLEFAVQRIHGFFGLKNYLLAQAEKLSQKQEVEKPDLSAKFAFIGILTVFRRARPLPLIRSVLDRCILGPSRRDQSSSIESRHFFEVIEHSLLREILGEDPADEDQSATDQAVKPTGPVKPKKVVVGQRHEGDSIWIYREIHESVFDSLTTHLSLSEWVRRWSTPSEIGDGECESKACAVLNGLLMISWHWEAARAYYADVFMPTRDVDAFFEYIYHRMSVLRICTLLSAILYDPNQDQAIIKACERNTENTHDNSLPLQPSASKTSLLQKLTTYLPRYSSAPAISDAPNQELRRIVAVLKDLRSHGIETMERALRRNQEFLRSVATPDTLLGWTDQLLERELLDITGEIFSYSRPECDWNGKSGNAGLDALFTAVRVNETVVNRFREVLRDISSAERLTKLEFETALQESVAASLNNEIEEPESDTPRLEINDVMTQAAKCFNSLEDDPWQSCGNAAAADQTSMRIRNLLSIGKCWSYYSRGLNSSASEQDPLVRMLHRIGKPQAIFLAGKPIQREAFELLTKHLLAKVSLYWEKFDCRNANSCEEQELRDNAKKSLCVQAEAATIEFERLVRETADNPEDDARHRSVSLALRARSQYLRAQFRQAHQNLDLASSGLDRYRPEHSIARTVVHMYRAELLCYSADWHFKEECEGEDGHIMRIREAGAPGSPQSSLSFESDLVSGIIKERKKVDRAEEELQLAEHALRTISHQTAWRLRVSIGLAQVRLEQLLFHVEEVFWLRDKLSEDRYQELSGEMERLVLRGMENIRNVLDVLPYNPALIVEEGSENRFGTQPDRNCSGPNEPQKMTAPGGELTLFRTECKAYALWRQYFVAGCFFTALLRLRRESPRLPSISPQDIDSEITAVAGEATSLYHLFRIRRWNLWCESLRFDLLKDCSVPVQMPSMESEFTEWKPEELIPSLRAMIVQVMYNACRTKSKDKGASGEPSKHRRLDGIVEMWNLRREPRKDSESKSEQLERELQSDRAADTVIERKDGEISNTSQADEPAPSNGKARTGRRSKESTRAPEQPTEVTSGQRKARKRVPPKRGSKGA